MAFRGAGEKFPTEQILYAKKVKEHFVKEGNLLPKATVVTYGCQQNVSDSERIKGMLVLMGYTITEDMNEADFILFNTCAVRGHAEDRVYGNVGATKKYKKVRPNMIIAVCGCMAQQQSVADTFKKSYPYVDIVIGTAEQYRLPEFVYNRLSGSKRIFSLNLESPKIIEDCPVERDRLEKGWLPIMYGCNNFCSYCIVPYVRGRERSRKAEDVLKEARELIALGYKEIMLLGQNVNSYRDGETDFAKLLRAVNDLEGDFEISFMTSHPKDCSKELLCAMRDCKKVKKHLHLPFQSGSDRILKLMNRGYTAEKYLSMINLAREMMPDIVFTSDIIVGFPGETYEDFKKTLELIKNVKFKSLFTFIYSSRGGTPAAKMDDPISREEKGIWFDELLKLQEEVQNIKGEI